MERARGCVFIAVSVDGFIARPAGGLDWLEAEAMEGEDYGYRAFVDSIDAVVMGRGTYDKVLTFGDWPFGGTRVIVATKGSATSWHGEEFWSGARRLSLGIWDGRGLPGSTWTAAS